MSANYIFYGYSYTDDIIIILNFIFTDLHGYQTTPGLSGDKKDTVLKTGIHVAPTYLQAMLQLWHYIKQLNNHRVVRRDLEETLDVKTLFKMSILFKCRSLEQKINDTYHTKISQI